MIKLIHNKSVISITLFYFFNIAILGCYACSKESSNSLRSDKEVIFSGPLIVSPDNPRYFTNDSGKAIYLTGSHTWNNFVDEDMVDPPKPFDYLGYLIFLQSHNHNFIRMWAWRPPRSRVGRSVIYSTPQPWPRIGPGNALDGKLKFDLSQFNQSYFDRLRTRVIAARDRGIYVSDMLFEGWGLASDKEGNNDFWTWHPFNINNNINGIDADTDGDSKGYEFYTQFVPSAVKDIQKAYIRKIVDTVNDLDNVLYEIVNEANTLSVIWQYEMINYLKGYEATKSKQHPVGMTFPYRHPNNIDLFNSPADWISPGYLPKEDYRNNPPASDGRKVIILDTDHLWGVGGDRAWVWKSFLRGYNPIHMDDLSADPKKEDVRKAMEQTLIYANKMNLISMFPHNDLSSTTYCLANPGSEYLIYKPMSRNPLKHFFMVNLKGGTYRYEWFNPGRGVVVSTGSLTVADGNKLFIPPFVGDAVLYIYSNKE